MVIIVGKTNYFYDTRAEEDVCKAHVLHILPHPEREDDRLIVYRWYGKHRQRWWYGVTTLSQQEMWADYVQKVIDCKKQRKMCRKCGQCGYYMAYAKTDGTKDHYGDCASIGMNNECNEGNNHFKDPDEMLLQVDEKEDACGFFKAKRTKRVKEYIKAHPDDYYKDTNFKPRNRQRHSAISGAKLGWTTEAGTEDDNENGGDAGDDNTNTGNQGGNNNNTPGGELEG